jgi:hypothetical protein
VRRAESAKQSKAKQSEVTEEISNQQPAAISNQQSATSINGGWTIPAAAHIWALNGFSGEIDMGHEGTGCRSGTATRSTSF